MSAAYDLFASKERVNVLKKVKVQGAWKMCPAVVEPNGKLKDRVKINGHIEVHSEGVYFLEWRENGKRVREAVRDKADVIRLARLKALEIDAEGVYTSDANGQAYMAVKRFVMVDWLTRGHTETAQAGCASSKFNLALKIAPFRAATAAPSRLSLHLEPRICPRRARAV